MSAKIDRPAGRNADLIEYWILKALVKLHGHRRFARSDGFTRDEVMYALGLERFENREEKFYKDAILKLIRGRYQVEVSIEHGEVQLVCSECPLNRRNYPVRRSALLSIIAHSAHYLNFIVRERD